MIAHTVLVDLAEIKVLKGHGQLSCLGLGSCIAICALDAVSGVGGVAHLMLPGEPRGRSTEKPGTYVASGIVSFIEQMQARGADPSRLVAALVGGAHAYRFGSSIGSQLEIGPRNSSVAIACLEHKGVRILAQDIGGNLSRMLTFDIETGVVDVRKVTLGERTLCNLREG